MKKFYLVLVAASLAVAAKAQTPSWSNGIASIIYNKCSSCHHAGNIAPFPLMSYQDAYMYASGIESAVSDDRMPPWPPDETYRRYAHERMLSSDEKSQLLAWVGNGAPEGDPGTAPTPPVYTSNWAIQNPDLTLRMPDYTSPATTQDLYRCFTIPAGNTTDKYIKRIEVIPGNRAAVHHVLVFQENTGQSITLDNNDPGPGYTNFGGSGVTGATLITGWVPGSSSNALPNGFGIRLKANSNIVMQVHYPAGSAGMLDSTRINIEYVDGGTPREMFVAPALNHFTALLNGPLSIPANTVKKYEEVYTIPNIQGITAISAFSVAPHMHLIGRSIKTYALSPSSTDTIPLIKINNWDFHWQGSYTFQYPQKLPVGTVIRGEAIYDNTTNNPFNPNSPPQNVSAGESTTEEMMVVYFTYAYYQPGDENIVLDSTLLETSTHEIPNSLAVDMFPNPVNHDLYVGLPDNKSTYTLTVFNNLGQAVLSRQITETQWVDVSELTPGVYIATVSGNKGRYTQKLVKY